MKAFDLLAAGFAAVAALNVGLYFRKGPRALGLALSAGLASAACWLWERAESTAPYWLLGASAGMFLATALYEAAKRRIEP